MKIVFCDFKKLAKLDGRFSCAQKYKTAAEKKVLSIERILCSSNNTRANKKEAKKLAEGCQKSGTLYTLMGA